MGNLNILISMHDFNLSVNKVVQIFFDYVLLALFGLIVILIEYVNQ